MRFAREHVENILALGPMQEGLLFQYLLNPKNQQYFEQLSLSLSGGLQKNAFSQAWTLVVQTNEMLRTVFRWEGIEKPIQIVLKEQEVVIRQHDLSVVTNLTERGRLLNELKENDRMEQFDLAHGPLFRITLCKLAEDQYEMILSNHHILFDGWSTGVIMKEFFQAYHEFARGHLPAKPRKTGYREFLKWCNKLDQTEIERYWHTYLHGLETRTLLPYDCKKTEEITVVSTITSYLPIELCQQIETLARAIPCTPGSVFAAAWGILLHIYNHQDDILFGTAVAGRPNEIPGIEEMVGLFINTVPVRVSGTRELTVQELIGKLQNDLQMGQQYGYISPASMKALRGVQGEESLFDSLFVFENYPLEQRWKNASGGLQIKNYSIFEMTNYDLVLEITAFDQVEVNFTYNRDLLAIATIERMAKHYAQILWEMVLEPGKAVKEIQMITVEEREQILYQFNATSVKYPLHRTMIELFAERVQEVPDRTALIFGETQMTYREFDKRTHCLARQLQEKGVKPNNIVGIMMDRSLEMLIGIYGILKAGGAYLPIDPAHPAQRKEFMLKDSEARILLTPLKYAEEIGFDGEIMTIEMDDPGCVQDHLAGESVTTPTDLAYIIYTSGSTGQPKGVMIEHHNVINILHTLQEKYPIRIGDTYLLKTAYTFDVSVAEIFGWMMGGGRLAILHPGDERDPGAILQAVDTYKVSHLNFVPAMFDLFLSTLENGKTDQVNSVRYIFVAGEAISRQAVERFLNLNTGIALENLYGPTETTIYATGYPLRTVPTSVHVPIGKPLANVKAYILDEARHLQAIGVPGELYLTGQGLARGYLKQSSLTEEMFVSNPFVPGERMYRTGDLVKWLSDGNIEYLGRIDHQVKIRGYRIELGEIEARLLEHPEVQATVVIAREGNDQTRYLCAYYVSDVELEIEEISAYVKERLPEYMVPAFFVRLEAIPLTASGKTDRQALPAPNFNTPNQGYIAPRDEMEERLAQIWTEVLGVERPGVRDNFFALGGHSLKATRLMTTLQKELGVEFPLREFFKRPTIEDLASAIREAQRIDMMAIPTAPIQEFYPVSSAQKRLFVLHQWEGGTSYHLPAAFEVKGKIDLERLNRAFGQLVERHESLRTSFVMMNGEPVQRIEPEVPFTIRVRKADADLDQAFSDFVQPFDLSSAPLMRVELLYGENQQFLLFDMHHIISDGVSMGILVDDLIRLYQGEILPEQEIQYKDYAVWQNDDLQSHRMKAQEAYWLAQFADEVPVLDVPTDTSRPATMRFVGEKYLFTLDAEITQELHQLARKTNTTLFMVLLAVYNVLLAKYSSQEDIVIGSPIAGRNYAGLEKIVGMFVNTLALRNYPESTRVFEQFLSEVGENTVRAFEHQDYPFETLVDRLHLSRDRSRNPLFDVVFVLQNTEMGRLHAHDFELHALPFDNQIAKFDITLSATEITDGIQFYLEYRTDLFRRETIERMAGHFINLLRGVAVHPACPIHGLKMISAAEEKQLLYVFNHTDSDYPCGKTVQQIFEEQVIRFPERIAIAFGEKGYTYRELNERANQVARLLREKGAGPERIIGIMVERSLEMITGILAIVKSGAAYLPIDPDYPADRIEYMLEDAGVGFLLTQHHVKDKLAFTGEMIDLTEEQIYTGDMANLANLNEPDNLLYIIYTSGSTGKPKGVMIEHRNLIRLMCNDDFQFDFTENDIWTVFHSYCFDFSVWEMYGALLYGGKAIVISKRIAQSPAEFLRVLRTERVTVLNQTPTAFYNLIKEDLLEDHHEEILSRFPTKESLTAREESLMQGVFQHFTNDLCLRYVIFGGEALKPIIINDWHQKYPETKLINMYGITETTVHVTFKELTDQEIASNVSNIGKPIPTLTNYIMDQHMHLLPIGVPGELCVGGDGVARGYLNRPELTDQKFVQNPYRPEERLYRSGDLVRLLPSGDMEYLGRIDHQVKIRGFRIELGEIENQLLKHPDVKEVIVIPRENREGEKYLCAYLVTTRETPVTELRNHLGKDLPEYMIPAYFVILDQMPLTPNGKINRTALPEASVIRNGQDYLPPATEMETKLAEIWAKVLEIEQVSRTDHFFELGGDSIKAIRLINRIQQELGLLIQMRDVFEALTLEDLALVLERTQKTGFLEIARVGHQEFYPVSSAQQRIFMLNDLEGTGTSTVYNIPFALEMMGTSEPKRLHEAFQRLIERHEALRTSFTLMNDEPVQTIASTVHFAVEYHEAKEQELEQCISQFIRPFALDQAPLMRVQLLNYKGRTFILFDIHHIIADGETMNILIEDLIRLYNGETLPELRVQYKDFAEWQNQCLQSEPLKKQETFWLETFSGEIPVLHLPTDYPRPARMNFSGETYYFVLDTALTTALRRFAQETDITLYMLLLAGYCLLLSGYSGQEDIVIGSPIAERTHAELENMVGMFVNTLAIRNYPESEKRWIDFVKEVKGNILEALENQEYPFEKLIEKLNPKRNKSRNPLFDVVFVMQSMNLGKLKGDGFELKPYPIASHIAKFDLVLSATDTLNEIQCYLEYRTSLFTQETIEKMVSHFKNILEEVIETPLSPLWAFKPTIEAEEE